MATKRKRVSPPKKPAGSGSPVGRRSRGELFASILSGVQDYVLALDRDLRCAFISEWTAAQLGATPSELEGRSWERFEQPGMNTRWRQDAQEVLDQGLTVRAETWVNQHGEQRFYEYVASPIFDEAGKPELVLFVSRDVTVRRRAEAQAHALHRRLQLLSEASRTLSAASPEFEDVLGQIAEVVAGAVGGTCLVCWAVANDGASGRLGLRHPDRKKQEALQRRLREQAPPLDGPLAQRVLASGEPVLLENPPDGDWRAQLGQAALTLFDEAPCRSLMVAPLSADARPRGLMVAMGHDDAPYTSADLSLLTDLSERAGLAAARAELFASERRSREEAEAAAERERRLQAYTAALAGCSTPEEVMRVGLEGAIEASRAHGGTIYRVSPDGVRLQLIRASGVADEVLHVIRDMPLEPGRPMAKALLERRALYLESAEAIHQATPAPIAREVRPVARALAALPLLAGEKPEGVLGLGFNEDRAFEPEERHLMEALALQAASALERVRLIEAERRSFEHRLFIAEAGELFASTLDEERIVASLARKAVPRVADWCGIDLADADGRIQSAAVAHVDPERVAFAHEFRRRYPPDASQPGGVHDVLRTGKPVIAPVIPEPLLAAAAQDAEHLAAIRQLGMRSAMVVPLLAGGKALGAITLVWAETPRHYNDEDLRFASELGQRAGLALQNARLYRDLRVAVEARDEFLAMAGHELKTPITALLLQLQSAAAVSRRAPEDPVLTRIQKAVRSAGRLEKLVNQLLDVSRITGARLALDPEPADFVEIVSEAVGRMADAAQAVGSPISVEAPEAVHGEWDRLRVDQVLTNLISNALKYGHGKPVHVRVVREDPGVALEVRDEGIGIPADQQARIFERFERAVAARSYGGLGLGLWITRQIVESAGGRIEVLSSPGEGAVFRVWLPCHPALAPAAAEAPSTEAPSAEQPPGPPASAPSERDPA